MKSFFTEADCDVNGKSDWRQQACLGISLDKANRLVEERGRVVYGQIDGDGPYQFSALQVKASVHGEDTHQAFLINIEPIEQDSAEKFVRDLVSASNHPFSEPWMDRAKALLEKK